MLQELASAKLTSSVCTLGNGRILVERVSMNNEPEECSCELFHLFTIYILISVHI